MPTTFQPAPLSPTGTPAPDLRTRTAAHAHPNTTFRLGVLIITLALEGLTLAQFPHPWLRAQQPMAAPIVFLAALFFFARHKLATLHLDDTPVSLRQLLTHVTALLVAGACNLQLLHRTDAPPRALEALIIASLLLLIVSVTLALFPLAILVPWLRSLGPAWLYAALLTAATMAARAFVRLSWDTANSAFGRLLQRATFAGVHALLGILYPVVIADPAAAILGTPRFTVRVAGACSGIEGLALMLVFTLGWLLATRRELRLRRALWLIPIALALIWILNLVRIAALISLGDHGHRGLAPQRLPLRSGLAALQRRRRSLPARRPAHADPPPTHLTPPHPPTSTLSSRPKRSAVERPASPALTPHPTNPPQPCHLDRSAAQWRDLLHQHLHPTPQPTPTLSSRP